MNDYYGLLKKLEVVKGKPFSKEQAEEMVHGFQRIPFSACQWIVKSISRLAQLPNNLFGVVLSRIDEEHAKVTQNLENKTRWNAQAGCMTTDEWNAGMSCLAAAAALQMAQEWYEQFASGADNYAGTDQFLQYLKSTQEILIEERKRRGQLGRENAIAQISELTNNTKEAVWL